MTVFINLSESTSGVDTTQYLVEGGIFDGFTADHLNFRSEPFRIRYKEVINVDQDGNKTFETFTYDIPAHNDVYLNATPYSKPTTSLLPIFSPGADDVFYIHGGFGEAPKIEDFLSSDVYADSDEAGRNFEIALGDFEAFYSAQQEWLNSVRASSVNEIEYRDDTNSNGIHASITYSQSLTVEDIRDWIQDNTVTFQLSGDTLFSQPLEITGSNQNDTLGGGNENDTILGGLGSDTYIVSRGESPSEGSNTFYGGKTETDASDFLDLNTRDVVEYNQAKATFTLRADPFGSSQGVILRATYDAGGETDNGHFIDEFKFTEDGTWTQADVLEAGAIAHACMAMDSAFTKLFELVQLPEINEDDPSFSPGFKKFLGWITVGEKIAQTGAEIATTEDLQAAIQRASVISAREALFPAIDQAVEWAEDQIAILPNHWKEQAQSQIDSFENRIKTDILNSANDFGGWLGEETEDIRQGFGKAAVDLWEDVKSKLDEYHDASNPTIDCKDTARDFNIDEPEPDADLYNEPPNVPDPGENSDPTDEIDVIILPGENSNIRGTLAELHNDIVVNFSTGDSITIEGANFGRGDVNVTLGSAILDIDSDGDGTPDAAITLEGDFTGGDFVVSSGAANTVITFEALLSETTAITGTVTGPDGTPLPDTAIRFLVTGTQEATDITDAAGAFTLDIPPGTGGQLTLERDVTAEDIAQIGVSDALDALRLAVGLEPSWGPADAADFVAADFDADGSVGVSDALDILRIAVGLDTGSQPRWAFGDIESDTVDADTVPVLNNELDIAALSADTQVNVQGILVGNMENYV